MLSVSVTSLPPGSSPRVWGQEKNTGSAVRSTGIIPTRVGTSCSRKYYTKGGVGSSPRVWGQEFVTVGLFAFARIIPTRMGTRVCYLGFVCLCQDHPHAYGDKQLSLTLSVMLRGSSPRVWGQVRAINSPLDIERIIPTRMGTSKQRYRNCHNRRDHPHAYGDKY